MARYNGPVCRLCRREGMKLFLKGDRCFTEKCAIEKRNYAPGQHGKGGRIKSKLQGYGLQLREKQKTKRLYGMLEGQFALTFDRASQEKGVVGETLLSKLERRLDNVIYRLGFGSSRAQARQLVRHGHVRVNEKKLNQHGIFHFDQIAAWKKADVVLAETYLAFDGRIAREEWVKQAKLLAKGKDTEFSRRVDAGKVATSHASASAKARTATPAASKRGGRK